jgi:Cft2 family RNA processing exonuclease
MGEKKQIRLTALGGSGENGRNCFAIEYGGDIFLLDCGVKREIRGGQVGFYPSLTKDFVKRIKAVFVSHCHEDHTAALPLLYESDYRGKVYVSEETKNIAGDFVSKWMAYAEKNGGKLPFDRHRAAEIQFETLPLGKSVCQGIPITTGRSGHVLGGIWFQFTFDGETVFYSGDMVLAPMLLQADTPPESGAAILNCAYAGKRLASDEQYQRLCGAARSTAAAGGMALLPVPPSGRGCDIYYYLSQHLSGINLFVEQKILDSYKELLTKEAWINRDLIRTRSIAARVIPIADQIQRAEAFKGEAGVYLAGDGMFTTEESQFCYEHVKSGKGNTIIITGHAAAGTIAAGISDALFRAKNGVECGTEKIIFKVHLDDDDVTALNKKLRAKNIILFHADKEQCHSSIQKLKESGAIAVCLSYPDWLALP